MSGVVVMAYLLAIGFLIVAWGLATHKHPDRQDGQRKPPASRGTTRVPYHCATFGHYYRKAFADRWQCAQCGHLVPMECAGDFDQWEQEVEA